MRSAYVTSLTLAFVSVFAFIGLLVACAVTKDVRFVIAGSVCLLGSGLFALICNIIDWVGGDNGCD